MVHKPHYGWAVCFGGSLLILCTVGLALNAFTVFLPFILSAHDFSNTQGAMINTIRCLFSVPALALAPRYLRRTGLRLGVTLAALLVAGAHALYAAATQIEMYYLAAALIGIGYGFGSMLSVSLLIDRWFVQHRGLALGFCASWSGLGTLIAPTVITLLVEHYGLRTAFLVEAGFMLLAALIVFAVIRNYPAEKGCAALGAQPGAAACPPQAAAGPTVNRHASLPLMLSLLLLGMVAIPGTTNMALHYSIQGYGSMTVALAVSLFGFTLVLGKCLFGLVDDRIGGYRTNYVFLGLLICGLILCAAVGGGARFPLLAACALMGMGFPVSTVGLSIWAADLADAGAYADMLRRFQILYIAGGLIGSPLPGIIADYSGSYTPAYVLYAGMIVITLAIVQYEYRRRRRKKAQPALTAA